MACLEPNKNSLQVYSCDIKADIQCLLYDSIKSCVYFNINNTLYQLKEDKLSVVNKTFPAAKFIYPYKKQYFVASSFGLYLYDDFVKSEPKEWLLKSWSREITYNEHINRLFVATNDGLIVMKTRIDEWIVEDTLLKGKQINSIALDNEQKKLYALSFENIIYEIDESNRVQQLFKLPSPINASQIRLNGDYLYISSNAGLIKYDIIKRQYFVLDKLSGLTSNEVLGISFLDNSIYLATSVGINQLPIKGNDNEVHSKLYLESVLADNKRVDSNAIDFNYNQTLSLKLTGLSYSSGNSFNYAYRIVSSDSTWVKLPATIESIEFQSMPYGDFILEVKLINHLGKDSENVIVLKGRVNPPFWQSTWFMILEAAVLVVLLLLLFKYRIKKIRKKQLEELKKIKLENELRLVQQSALKAQMNPHFIFNVLNSIKGYIYDNDKKNAVLYLSNFAELMRKILHNSSYDKIKLAEELEILKIYIDLEAMQFEGDFEYELKLSNDLDIDAVQIPGLLIQPYIENAFKHGLRHKKGQKKLSLDLSRTDNSLQIKITDNGIGLVASKQINETVNKSHQSFASNATERRIELLNNNAKDIVHVKILNNLDAEHNVAGTVVILTIQLD